MRQPPSLWPYILNPSNERERAFPAKNLSCATPQPPSLSSTVHVLRTAGSLLVFASFLSIDLHAAQGTSWLNRSVCHTICACALLVRL